MKKSRYSDSQIIGILNQAKTGAKVPDLCREHGMSEATFYKWLAKYGGMDASRHQYGVLVTADFLAAFCMDLTHPDSASKPVKPIASQNAKLAADLALVDGHKKHPPSPIGRLIKMSCKYVHIYS
jgi:Transposase